MSAPLLLAIETATEVCSVCIGEGSQVLSLRESSGKNDHSAVITLLIMQILEEATIRIEDIDAVAISTGPGSYTSLRVGTSVAKGICYALDKPLLAVDTLRALAYAANLLAKDKTAFYCPMIDARRMEVYTRLFDARNEYLSELGAVVLTPDFHQEYYLSGQKIVYCGNGAKKLKSTIFDPLAEFSPLTACSAAYMLPLAAEAFSRKEFENLSGYVPVYLKPPNITSPSLKT